MTPVIAVGVIVGFSACLSAMVWVWSLMQGDYQVRCSALLATSLALVVIYALAYA